MALNHDVAIDQAAALDAIMASEPVESGRMFGCPAYFFNGLLVAALVNGGVAVKVGASRAKALIREAGIGPFEPLRGRVWREWVHITGNLDDHRGVLAEAVEYALVVSGG